MSSRARSAVGVSVIAGALLYLVVSGLGNGLVYFLTPSELLSQGAEAYDVPIRLSGQVEPGSIQFDAESASLRFRVTDESNTVEVESTGIPPEMFSDGIDVVLEGSLAASGVFRANSLMVKHSNEYGPAEGFDESPRPVGDLSGAGRSP